MTGGVVVVGGGIGGVSTIAALRAGGYDDDVTLIDGGEFPYDRPPLSKEYLAGTAGIKDIALQPPQWFDDQRVRLISRSVVTALRTDIGAVELADGSMVPAERVVLATGGKAARPPIPGADSSRVHVLRTAEDADRLRAALIPGAQVLIVGAGLIGAEVASTACSLGCEVVVTDPVSPPLAVPFGVDVAIWLHGVHAARGITTLHGAVSAFDDTGDTIAVQLSGEERPRTFDVAVLAVGMAADTALAQAAGLEVNRGIVVDHRQQTSNAAVFAVGDAAVIRSDGSPGHRSEHWEAAQHDGARAAAAVLGTAEPADTAPWFWTDRHGLHVEVVGALGHVEEVATRGVFGEEPFSVFGLQGGHVVGAVSVGDSTATRAARRMIDRGTSVTSAQLSDPGTDLRKLLRQ
jgi:3-phenylpropionate/trans-cinnamate dioxygenase ferredoxin reductase component